MLITVMRANELVAGGRIRTKLLLETTDGVGLDALLTKLNKGVLTPRGGTCFTEDDDRRYANYVLRRLRDLIAALDQGESALMYFGLLPNHNTRAMLRDIDAKRTRLSG